MNAVSKQKAIERYHEDKSSKKRLSIFNHHSVFIPALQSIWQKAYGIELSTMRASAVIVHYAVNNPEIIKPLAGEALRKNKTAPVAVFSQWEPFADKYYEQYPKHTQRQTAATLGCAAYLLYNSLLNLCSTYNSTSSLTHLMSLSHLNLKTSPLRLTTQYATQ